LCDVAVSTFFDGKTKCFNPFRSCLPLLCACLIGPESVAGSSRCPPASKLFSSAPRHTGGRGCFFSESWHSMRSLISFSGLLRMRHGPWWRFHELLVGSPCCRCCSPRWWRFIEGRVLFCYGRPTLLGPSPVVGLCLWLRKGRSSSSNLVAPCSHHCHLAADRLAGGQGVPKRRLWMPAFTASRHLRPF